MNQTINSLEKIEILSLGLFDTHHEEMNIVEQFQNYFGAELGWHYYLDLAWIIREIRALPSGALVLDAGAGNGLLQFILSELGYNVISADFMGHRFPSKFIYRYRQIIYSLNNKKVTFNNSYARYLNSAYIGHGVSKLSKLFDLFKIEKKYGNPIDIIDRNKLVSLKSVSRSLLEGDALGCCGRIFIYKCDLKNMPLLPDDLVDVVVSVSALEHNDHEDLEKCLDEMIRVTKPAGRLLITVSAAQSEDYFHEPSRGWCYSEATLHRLFRLREDIWSNFPQKDLFFSMLLKENNKLHKKLAPVYFRSADNGMPWGKWDPQYQPVGIVKIKNYSMYRNT